MFLKFEKIIVLFFGTIGNAYLIHYILTSLGSPLPLLNFIIAILILFYFWRIWNHDWLVVWTGIFIMFVWAIITGLLLSNSLSSAQKITTFNLFFLLWPFFLALPFLGPIALIYAHFRGLLKMESKSEQSSEDTPQVENSSKNLMDDTSKIKHKSKLRLILLIAVGIWLIIALVSSIKSEVSTENRIQFMRRIMFAVNEGTLVNYTNQELITHDLAKDLYTYNEGEVIHNFGGKVYVRKNDDKVSVVYENIPKGKKCYEFYYKNDPAIYGFKETYIDGVLEEYDFTGSKNWTPIIEEFKQRVCYSGKKTVTIEFRGDINDIKKRARSIGNLNALRD